MAKNRIEELEEAVSECAEELREAEHLVFRFRRKQMFWEKRKRHLITRGIITQAGPSMLQDLVDYQEREKRWMHTEKILEERLEELNIKLLEAMYE